MAYSYETNHSTLNFRNFTTTTLAKQPRNICVTSNMLRRQRTQHSTCIFANSPTRTHTHKCTAWSSYVSHSLAPTCSPALRLPTSAAYDISDVGGVVTLCKFANFLPILLPSFILCWKMKSYSVGVCEFSLTHLWRTFVFFLWSASAAKFEESTQWVLQTPLICVCVYVRHNCSSAIFFYCLLLFVWRWSVGKLQPRQTLNKIDYNNSNKRNHATDKDLFLLN